MRGRYPHLALSCLRSELRFAGRGAPFWQAESRTRWAVGTITAHEWCCVSKDWRVGVTFDRPNGTWYGMAIRGTTTFTDYVRVIGGPRRSFSSMTEAEIDAFLDDHQRQRD